MRYKFIACLSRYFLQFLQCFILYELRVGEKIVWLIVYNAIISEKQSGFRKGHSTTTVPLKLKDDILHAMIDKE